MSRRSGGVGRGSRGWLRPGARSGRGGEKRREGFAPALREVGEGGEGGGRVGALVAADRRRPADLAEMLDRWLRPRFTAQLMVLARNARKAAAYSPAPVEIPPLRTRRDELDRLILELEAEAVRRLGIEAHALELTPAHGTLSESDQVGYCPTSDR